MNYKLIILPELESTQDHARQLALLGEPDGTAVMTLRQTKGRGRMGRAWVSPPERNLALSLILRPNLAPSQAAMLGLAASIAVAEAIETMGIARAELKWPNDVLVASKKIAGILPEAHLNTDRINFVIMGIGLNVNLELDDLPVELHDTATSIFLETGQMIDLEACAETLLQIWQILYTRIIRDGIEFVPGLWSTRWAHLGARVAVKGAGGILHALDIDGSLIVRLDDKTFIRVSSGEIEPLGSADLKPQVG
jgi:BirA family transcriptional regulator, biotin operon repressor / biotin---[acetyl-CoA-carboxylase] ligase